MSISDADFALWLEKDSAERRVLFELDYVYQAESFVDPDIIYTPTIGTIYLADGDYQTLPTDTPASVAYVDAVLRSPSYSREINRRTLSGRGSVSIGVLELANADGELDFLLDLAVDGSEIRCYLGDASWPRADFRLVYTAMIERIDAPTTKSLLVSLTDHSALLNASIAGTFIGGSGPNAERTKPVVFGYCIQCECLQISTADLTYQVASDGDIRVGTVRDTGLSITDGLAYAGTDSVLIWDTGTERVAITAHGYIDEDIVYLSTTGTFPTGLSEGYWFVRNKTADDFQLSATRTGSVANITSAAFSGTVTITRRNYIDHQDGTLTLAHPPYGIVTCDVLTMLTLLDRSAYFGSDIIRSLIVDHSNVADYTGNITPDHFTIGDPDAFDEDDHDFLMGVKVSEKRNLLDVLDDVSETMAVFYGFNRDAEFIFGRINPAVSGTSVMDFTEDDIRGEVRVTRADPAYISYNFVFNKNWTVLTDFLAAVPDEDVARFSARGRYGSGFDQGVVAGDPPVSPPYSYSPELYHKTMAQGSEVETLLSAIDDADAYNQGTAWFRLYRQMMFPWLEFIDITVGMRAYELELGNVVSLTMDRYGFDAGIEAQVVGIDLRPSSADVGLTLCWRRTADVSEDLHLA